MFHRCEPAEVARVRKQRNEQNPYGSQVGLDPAAASRDAGTAKPDPSEPAASPTRLHGRGGPIGVVKLLRARGGCLGVIRIRAWKAAKGPGELPNERRSRNARSRPGELKHLSTRRKRNQPRLPQ